jgi:hypothetical protein
MYLVQDEKCWIPRYGSRFHVKYSICAVQSNPVLNSGIFIFALFLLFQTQKLCLALLQYQARRLLKNLCTRPTRCKIEFFSNFLIALIAYNMLGDT